MNFGDEELDRWIAEMKAEMGRHLRWAIRAVCVMIVAVWVLSGLVPAIATVW